MLGEKENTEKQKEKWVGFSSLSIFPVRKLKAPDGEDTQGACILKGWDDKRDHGRIPDTFTYYKNNTSAGPLTPQQLNPDSIHPIYIYLLNKDQNPTTTGSAHININITSKEREKKERKVGRAKKRKGIETQGMVLLNPSQAIDAPIGEEEQN